MKLPDRTFSLCPECLRKIPASYVSVGSDVWMEKHCPEHGGFRTIVWRGPPSLEEWSGGFLPDAPFQAPANCPRNCGNCRPHDRFG